VKRAFQLFGVLVGMITPDIAKDAMDAFLDVIEDKVKASANPIDNALVLPICGLIRKAFDIPDNDP